MPQGEPLSEILISHVSRIETIFNRETAPQDARYMALKNACIEVRS